MMMMMVMYLMSCPCFNAAILQFSKFLLEEFSVVLIKTCFLSFLLPPLSLLSFVSNLHFLALSLTNCLPPPLFQFIGGSNTDARLFFVANSIVLLWQCCKLFWKRPQIKANYGCVPESLNLPPFQTGETLASSCTPLQFRQNRGKVKKRGKLWIQNF